MLSFRGCLKMATRFKNLLAPPEAPPAWALPSAPSQKRRSAPCRLRCLVRPQRPARPVEASAMLLWVEPADPDSGPRSPLLETLLSWGSVGVAALAFPPAPSSAPSPSSLPGPAVSAPLGAQATPVWASFRRPCCQLPCIPGLPRSPGFFRLQPTHPTPSPPPLGPHQVQVSSLPCTTPPSVCHLCVPCPQAEVTVHSAAHLSGLPGSALFLASFRSPPRPFSNLCSATTEIPSLNCCRSRRPLHPPAPQVTCPIADTRTSCS